MTAPLGYRGADVAETAALVSVGQAEWLVDFDELPSGLHPDDSCLDAVFEHLTVVPLQTEADAVGGLVGDRGQGEQRYPTGPDHPVQRDVERIRNGVVTASDDPFWSLFWGSRYCSYPQTAGDLVSVIHEGDFYGTDRERRNDPMQHDLMRPIGCTHSMIMSMPAPAGQMRRLLFWRSSGPGFGERDRQVVTLLRPHLYEIWLGAERRRNNVPRLTDREWEVLRLSAAGLGNSEIAGQLVISVGTVRKHIEHILSRLGVHNRNLAASIALPHDPHLHQQVGPGTGASRSPR
jgi:DNA-binding CsgD family transcriptional regulator